MRRVRLVTAKAARVRHAHLSNLRLGAVNGTRPDAVSAHSGLSVTRAASQCFWDALTAKDRWPSTLGARVPADVRVRL